MNILKTYESIAEQSAKTSCFMFASSLRSVVKSNFNDVSIHDTASIAVFRLAAPSLVCYVLEHSEKGVDLKKQRSMSRALH